jgi:hypothetical protein
MDPRTARMLADHAQAEAAVPRPFRKLLRFRTQALAWLKASRVRAIVVSVATAVMLIVGYVSLIAVPAAERDRLATQARSSERLTAQVAARQTAVDACLTKAKTEAEAQWARACKAKGERAGCALPRRVIEEQQRRESEARNSCLMMGF